MKQWIKILLLLLLLIILQTVIPNLEGFKPRKRNKCNPIGLDSNSRPYKAIKELCEQQSCKEDSRRLCNKSGCKVWYEGKWHCCSKGCCRNASRCPPKQPSKEPTPYKPDCWKGEKAQKIISYESDSSGEKTTIINYGTCISCEDNDTDSDCEDASYGNEDGSSDNENGSEHGYEDDYEDDYEDGSSDNEDGYEDGSYGNGGGNRKYRRGKNKKDRSKRAYGRDGNEDPCSNHIPRPFQTNITL